MELKYRTETVSGEEYSSQRRGPGRPGRWEHWHSGSIQIMTLGTGGCKFIFPELQAAGGKIARSPGAAEAAALEHC